MSSRSQSIAVRCGVVLAIALAWALVFSMSTPRLWPGNYDYGFFTAVAERLRAGDRLYVDVWDNKDPLVFYSIAIARTFGAAGAWALELLWMLVLSGATFSIARSASLGRWSSAFTAFVATPIATVGVPYFMGTSHLPGVAFVLLAIALLLRQRPILAGIPLALLVFAKFVMLPLAVVLVVVIAWRTRSRTAAVRCALTFVAACAALCAVLMVRGELGGFLATQLDNILYSQSPIVQASYIGPVQKIAQHIVILINPHVVTMELTSLAIALASAVVYRARYAIAAWRDLPVLWWLAISAFIASGIIVALTGKWLHHAEVFVVSSALFLVVLVQVSHQFWRSPLVITCIITLFASYLLAGAPQPSNYAQYVRTLATTWADAQKPDELTTILAGMSPTSVAFVGWGNSLPRSPGLEDWKLACRHMAQRPFNPTSMFTETLDCLPTAQTIVVTRDFATEPVFPDYARFHDDVEALLASAFTCEETDGFRVCRRVT